MDSKLKFIAIVSALILMMFALIYFLIPITQLWARLKRWWKTRHARAAYRRLFDGRRPR
jgi:hypothetical protein